MLGSRSNVPETAIWHRRARYRPIAAMFPYRNNGMLYENLLRRLPRSSLQHTFPFVLQVALRLNRHPSA